MLSQSVLFLNLEESASSLSQNQQLHAIDAQAPYRDEETSDSFNGVDPGSPNLSSGELDDSSMRDSEDPDEESAVGVPRARGTNLSGPQPVS